MPSHPEITTEPQPPGACSALVGIFVAILFTVSCISHIDHFIDIKHMTLGSEHWIEIARTKAYGVCYDGCSDCLKVGSIEEACRMTTRANVLGVICDASKLWTWADRYPMECLQAVGEIYSAEALSRKKFWYRPLYMLIVLPLSYLSYLGTSLLLDQLYIPNPPGPRQKHKRVRQRSNSTKPLLTGAAVSIIALALPTPTSAYACNSYNPAHNQLFANVDGSLYGVIHGWISDCRDYSYSCGESCTASPVRSCSTIYCTRTYTNQGPIDFVRTAAKHVTECGFRLVDVVPGIVDRRIANPRIEGKLWVKVAVNRFNGSMGVEEQVKCLYDIVPAPSW